VLPLVIDKSELEEVKSVLSVVNMQWACYERTEKWREALLPKKPYLEREYNM